MFLSPAAPAQQDPGNLLPAAIFKDITSSEEAKEYDKQQFAGAGVEVVGEMIQIRVPHPHLPVRRAKKMKQQI